jgi:hypothetical protein
VDLRDHVFMEAVDRPGSRRSQFEQAQHDPAQPPGKLAWFRQVIDARMLARAVVHRRVPSNHRTRFLQEILRSGHDALDQYGQALMVSFVYPGL